MKIFQNGTMVALIKKYQDQLNGSKEENSLSFAKGFYHATVRALPKHCYRNIDKLRDRAGGCMGAFPVKPGQGQMTGVPVISIIPVGL